MIVSILLLYVCYMQGAEPKQISTLGYEANTQIVFQEL